MLTVVLVRKYGQSGQVTSVSPASTEIQQIQSEAKQKQIQDKTK